MEIRLLGPVGVWADGGELEAGPPKRRAVLALLALRSGTTVSADQIVDFVWDDVPPPQARRVVIVHVSRLRKLLADGGIAVRTVSAGYVLEAAADQVDAHRFRAVVTTAEQSAAAAVRSSVLRGALDLWRGDALSGVGDSELQRSMAAGLDRLRRTALERRITADLDCGRHAELEPELTELVARYPTHEGFGVALMLAASRSGHRSEALEVYERLRGCLADELGVDPGPDARSLFSQILHEDARSTPHSPRRVGSQFPAAARIFEGRADCLAELDRLAADENGVRLIVISGMGGVGKTALAVRWAASAADRFPDGQLYVDLRGFDGRRPLTSREALTRLLVAAGVSPTEVPSEPDTASGMLRSLLDERRAIVVLDNAHSASQVRDVLLGGRRTVVLVTSRNALTGLVARNDAHFMPIDVLRPDESTVLFERLLTQLGLSAEGDVCTRLGDLCGHLPLAIRILATNLGTDHGMTPAQMVRTLQDGRRLGAFEVPDDPATALAQVFQHSYSRLTDSERRLFRLLAVAPCVDYTIEAAAVMAGKGARRIASLAARLVSANMLINLGSDRIGFHDLIRELGGSRSRQHDTADERAEATDRLIGWYLGLGVAAHRVVNPQLAPVIPTVAFYDGPYPFGDDPAAAVALLNREMPNIVAVIRHAADHNREDAATQIPFGLYQLLEHGIAVSACIDLGNEALGLALRTGDTVAERRARINLGLFYNNARRPEHAIPHLQRGIKLAQEQGVTNSEASAYANLGVSYELMNDRDRALAAFLVADALRPNPPNSAVLNNIGNAYRKHGDFGQAETYLARALEVARSTGIQTDKSLTLDNLGHLELVRGNYELALERFQAAHDLATKIGNSRVLIGIDLDLAETNDKLGRPQMRRLHLQRALDMAELTGNSRREHEIRLQLKPPIN